MNRITYTKMRTTDDDPGPGLSGPIPRSPLAARAGLGGGHQASLASVSVLVEGPAWAGADGPSGNRRTGRDARPGRSRGPDVNSGVDSPTSCRSDLGYKGLEITGISITPVAFSDPPLLNQVGVHQPYALRAVIEVHTGSGLTGLGETYGDADHLDAAGRRRPSHHRRRCVRPAPGPRPGGQALAGAVGGDAHGLTGVVTSGRDDRQGVRTF